MDKVGIYIFSLTYFGLLVAIVLLLGIKMDLSIPAATTQPFLIGSAAMIGGSLAIVVSFALFTIQNASTHFPKDFYKLAADVRKYLFIFLINAVITFSLFLGSLSYGVVHLGLSALLIQLALVMIGISFYLMFFLLYQVRESVDPNKVLNKVSQTLLKLIQGIYERTEGYAKVLLLHPQNRGNASLESLIARLFQSSDVKRLLSHVNDRIDYLFDYHDSLLLQNQKSAALEVLGHIRELVLRYLYIRKNSSIAFPEENAIFVLTSDSKYVLQPILERMISLSEEYMKKENTTGVMRTVDVFIAWLSASSKVKYLGGRDQENPIFEQVSGYFNQLMERAIKLNSLEGMFQGLRFYRSLASLAIEKGYLHEFSSTLKITEDIGYQATKTRQEVVLQEVFSTYSYTLEKFIESEYSGLEGIVSMIMKHVHNMTLYGYALTARGTLRDNLIVQQDIAKPYNKFRDLIIKAYSKSHATDNPEEKSQQQKFTIYLIEELYSSLRNLAESTNPNHFLVLSFGRIIKEVGVLLITIARDQSWNEHLSSVEREILSYIHLPTWFLRDAKKIDDDQPFDSLIEAVTTMGLESLIEEESNTSSEAVKILHKIAVGMLEREKGKGAIYVEPSIMERACYIGIVALKQGRPELINQLKTAITEFEEKYRKVYFSKLPDDVNPENVSPSPDKLKQSVVDLLEERRRWERDRPGLRDSKEKMFTMATDNDVERFVQTIWGS